MSRADVFTNKDRMIIKILLDPFMSDRKIYKYCCKEFLFWSISIDDVETYYGDSFVKNTLNKLEKLGIIVSDMSEQEYRMQYALGTIKNWEFYIPTKSHEILEKLYEDYA